MSYKDKYLRHDTFYGDNIRESRIQETKRKLSQLMYDVPNYFRVEKFSPKKLIDIIITDDSDNQELKGFITKIDEDLFSGDSFYWNSQLWMVTHFDEMGEIYKSGKLRLSPSTLKWIDEYGTIFEYPFAFLTDNLSNFGIAEGKVISLLNDRRNIAIKSTEESQALSVGQRFIFDEAVWKVISINRLNPLVELVLESDTIDPNKDNMELRIADYVKPNYEIILNQTSISLAIGESYQINVIVTNNGIPLPSPTLSYNSSNMDICIIDEKGLVTALADGTSTISITYQDVSVSIGVIVEPPPTHNYSVIITGDDSIYKSRSKSYYCAFYDNGQPVSLSGVFKITDINNNPTSVAVIESQSNNTCVVRGDMIGTALLTVTDTVGLVSSSKKIQIKSAL
ncbi:Ig-like domain-containing protein [Paenibacillus sp. ISL-20]|uniref:Ig-like domain-containing protein n=1 Tax=Paenibacillus sp. ISL-20 TaxID=2819163 RepID=UPI001BE856AA|nr:Ig-like domain-containing protein [Paenibacillus sp. ISL-20]MBT2759852.1 Ig-like domain-containing protein [Paenibacillus sp. ISL-20]